MKAFKANHKSNPPDNSKYTMAWLNKKQQSIRAEKHVSDQHFAITEFEFHCDAFFTLSLELLNSLRSAVGLTQRIPPFGDKLRHGPDSTT